MPRIAGEPSSSSSTFRASPRKTARAAAIWTRSSRGRPASIVSPVPSASVTRSRSPTQASSSMSASPTESSASAGPSASAGRARRAAPSSGRGALTAIRRRLARPRGRCPRHPRLPHPPPPRGAPSPPLPQGASRPILRSDQVERAISGSGSIAANPSLPVPLPRLRSRRPRRPPCAPRCRQRHADAAELRLGAVEAFWVHGGSVVRRSGAEISGEVRIGVRIVDHVSRCRVGNEISVYGPVNPYPDPWTPR